MRLLSAFYPDCEEPSAYTVDYGALYEQGFRGILFDIDNTLVPHGAPATQEAAELFEKLHNIGFETILLSNNKDPRVKPFADAVGTRYLSKAGKPKRAGYEEAMRRMGTEAGTTLCVGDQIFTDIWGARRAGIRTILTKPIHPKEEIQIVLKRRLEWIVLRFYHRELRRNGK